MLDKLFVCTDLDRTLLPNGPEPESPGCREQFAMLAARPEVSLVFVTGRHRQLVEAAIDQYDLPVPAFIVADVGTTIYHVASQHDWWVQSDWQAEIAADWNGKSRAELEMLLRDIPALQLQQYEKQGEYKLSYYLPVDEELRPLTTEIEARLKINGVMARLVWSIDEQAGTGLLDILPARASKYHALLALMKQLGFHHEDTVFCGDSGNDLEVLASPIPAVLVANGLPSVRKQACQQASRAGYDDRLYLARGSWMQMNGNYSAGILEGIVHYYPDVLHWLPGLKQG